MARAPSILTRVSPSEPSSGAVPEPPAARMGGRAADPSTDPTWTCARGALQGPRREGAAGRPPSGPWLQHREGGAPVLSLQLKWRSPPPPPAPIPQDRLSARARGLAGSLAPRQVRDRGWNQSQPHLTGL